MILFERGRKPSSEVISYREKVYNEITKDRDVQLTAPELADKIGISTTEVRRALKFFQKQGIVDVVDGKKQTSLDGGRPATLWKLV